VRLEVQVPYHVVGHLQGDLGDFLRKCGQHQEVADDVDQPRDTPAVVVDEIQRARRKPQGLGVAGYCQPVHDIVAHLLAGQGLQVTVDADPLAQLHKLGQRQGVAQLRLSHQDDLQQFRVRALQVGEQADLLEQIGRQVLRLVDDQYGVLPEGVLLQKKVVELADQGYLVLARGLKPEVLVDHGQKLVRGDPGVEDLRERDPLVAFAEQVADQGGLAGADIAGKQDETGPFADTVVEVGQRLFVGPAQIDEIRVRDQFERLLYQVEKYLVHKKLQMAGATGGQAWRRRAERQVRTGAPQVAGTALFRE